jgi:hypothetical protein
MKLGLFLIFVVLILFYIFKPITKLEDKNFKNKRNLPGGF